jgi:hypothetical protein
MTARRPAASGAALVAASLLCTATLLVQESAMAAEEAPHRVLLREDAFELREYDAYVVAEVLRPPGGDEGDNDGFRRLFGYISGKNEGRRDIAMTTPVFTPPTRLAMTTPVTTRRLPEGVAMQFVLPSQYTIDTAPRPTDPAVRLRAVPAGRVAVWRFSGSASEKNVAARRLQLEEAVRKAGLATTGGLVLARYNAPFVPPFLRRNEIWLDVAAP